MAFINIPEATVTRVFTTSSGVYGVGLKETFTKRDGTEGASYYTAWVDDLPADVDENAQVKVNGAFSVRTSNYEKDGETRTGIDVNINNPKIELIEDEF